MTSIQTAPGSRIRLWELVSRPDGEDWIVGRPETGEFVSLPAEAITLLDALRAGGTVAEAKRHADLTHGEDIDALDFVGALIDLGFVAAVDGEPVAEEPPRPPSLRWLSPRHVSWMFEPPFLVLVAALLCAGLAATAVRGGIFGYSALFALKEPGLNLLLAAAISMSILALHEFCHLAAARAAGVPAWLGWGTRLFLLVAQTSVPGLWAAHRRVRIRVFLAGMAADLVVFSCCSIGASATSPAGVAHRVLAQTCLLALFGIAEQFAFYMRTDVYFVIAELAGCKNLFADATGYLSHRAGRLFRRGGSAARAADPLLELPGAERPVVRAYAALVLVGGAVTTAVFVFYALPAVIGSYARAVDELAGGWTLSRSGGILDAVALVVATLPFQVLFVRSFLRTHGRQLRRLLRGAGPGPADPVGDRFEPAPER